MQRSCAGPCTRDAREFLIEPLLPETVGEALTRAFARLPQQEKSAGKMFAFVAAKAGVGMTTLAANFAVALTKESGARVVIVDLDFQLGEIALGLGMTASFSVVDALNNAARLDRDLLKNALAHHSSGLVVLGATGGENFNYFPADEGAKQVVPNSAAGVRLCGCGQRHLSRSPPGNRL